MIDATRAVVYIQSFTPAFLHRDLKPSNFWVDDYGTCKLTDFGESRSFPAKQKTDGLNRMTKDVSTVATTAASAMSSTLLLEMEMRSQPDVGDLEAGPCSVGQQLATVRKERNLVANITEESSPRSRLSKGANLNAFLLTLNVVTCNGVSDRKVQPLTAAKNVANTMRQILFGLTM
ncbi:hypothetical protein PsorP6_006085 [Peronosclerospora sorghi]|uniref:Uncharacterized protein n=1 Tax=Peronosclerospora sorghi TaxID=230839 RepID=A0ACC0W364_9STRA|nr:hypothetical protein PsorP6_006085 [Peronosclerospora sorghi]